MSEIKGRQLYVLNLVGETMIMMQKIEAMLKACLLLIYGGENIEQSVKKFLNLDKKTLGALVAALKRSKPIPENFEKILIDLLEKRNLFIHNLFMQPWFSLSSEKGLIDVQTFCHSLLKDARSALPIFIAYASSSRTNRLLNKQDSEMFDTIIEQILITARPYFGEKSFEDYVNDIETEVKELKTVIDDPRQKESES